MFEGVAMGRLCKAIFATIIDFIFQAKATHRAVVVLEEVCVVNGYVLG